MRDPKRAMAAAILGLQAVVLGLTTPVMIAVEDVSTPVALVVGIGMCVLCILTAGMLGRRWGYAVGWGIQVVSIALGFVVITMLALGVIFASLWAGAVFLGDKIARERAEWEAAATAGDDAGGQPQTE